MLSSRELPGSRTKVEIVTKFSTTWGLQLLVVKAFHYFKTTRVLVLAKLKFRARVHLRLSSQKEERILNTPVSPKWFSLVTDKHTLTCLINLTELSLTALTKIPLATTSPRPQSRPLRSKLQAVLTSQNLKEIYNELSIKRWTGSKSVRLITLICQYFCVQMDLSATMIIHWDMVTPKKKNKWL